MTYVYSLTGGNALCRSRDAADTCGSCGGAARRLCIIIYINIHVYIYERDGNDCAWWLFRSGSFEVCVMSWWDCQGCMMGIAWPILNCGNNAYSGDKVGSGRWKWINLSLIQSILVIIFKKLRCYFSSDIMCNAWWKCYIAPELWLRQIV